LLTAYPVISWLVSAPSFTRLLVALWLSFAALLGFVATLAVRRRAIAAERAEGVMVV
jgi:hypothetical protein